MMARVDRKIQVQGLRAAARGRPARNVTANRNDAKPKKPPSCDPQRCIGAEVPKNSGVRNSSIDRVEEKRGLYWLRKSKAALGKIYSSIGKSCGSAMTVPAKAARAARTTSFQPGRHQRNQAPTVKATINAVSG